MTYYRNIIYLFAAISRRVRRYYECTLDCFDDGKNKGTIHICHETNAENILKTIEDILQRVHHYDVATTSFKGGEVTTIRVSEV